VYINITILIMLYCLIPYIWLKTMELSEETGNTVLYICRESVYTKFQRTLHKKLKRLLRARLLHNT